jgi:hypothetical protein
MKYFSAQICIRSVLTTQLIIASLTAVTGCSPPAASPTSPSADNRATSAARFDRAPVDSRDPNRDPFTTLDVVFPPRDQSLRFRQELEAYYRDVMRRSSTTSFVDLEGTIVWTQEYLRYRVNGCNHATAVTRVMTIIDGGAIGPVCSAASTPFPPRNEPFAFRQDLEAKYRDSLRRGQTTTFVDTEGDIVWTQEYFRFRTMGCTDAQSSARVMEQLQGAPPSNSCGGFCAISVSAAAESFNELGDSRSVTITTGAGCSWSARSNDSWLTIVSGASGSGTGTMRYQVAPMSTAGSRTGTITVGDQTITITQRNEPVVARFVMRQGGTPTGSCNLGGSGASNCSLDGTSSSGAVNRWQWSTTHFRTTGGNVSRNYEGATPSFGAITCTVNGNSQERLDITLTVSDASGRSATSSQSLSFSRAGCGT